MNISIPLEKPITLNAEQTASLKIGATGLSELFPKSSFTWELNSAYEFVITRHRYEIKKLKLPCLNEKDEIEIDSDPALDKINHVALFALKSLPKLYAHGANGQLYEAIAPSGEPVVLKIDKNPIGVATRQLFFIKTDSSPPSDRYNKYIEAPLSTLSMQMSLHSTCRHAEMLVGLPKSSHIPSFKGMVHVADLNAWGLIFEKIEGKTLEKLDLSGKKLSYVASLMAGLVKGLKILDKSGYPHNGIYERNIMVTPIGKAVVVDHAERSEYSGDSLSSRQQFGQLLERSLESKTIPRKIETLIKDCKSNKPMTEVSWNSIQRRLASSFFQKIQIIFQAIIRALKSTWHELENELKFGA